MELHRSSNPRLHIHHKQLLSLSIPLSDKSLHSRHMEGNSGVNQVGAGDLIPLVVEEEEEINTRDAQDHGDPVESDVLSRGWSRTGKRKENSTRARVINITGFSQDELEAASRPGDIEASQPGKEKLIIPLKKRRASESPSNAGNVHSPLSGSRILDPAAVLSASVNNNNNPAEIRNEYVCNICNRSFKSYQALGGHKAHHNSDEGDQDVSFTEERSGSSSRRPRKTNQVHQCPVCNRIFSQGQALGGHKRHCKGPVGRGGEVGTQNTPRVLDFDLNELPPEWIPDE